MRLLVMALVLPAAIVLGIVAFETRIFYPPPLNAPAKGIVWHGRTFAARDISLAGFDHGVSVTQSGPAAIRRFSAPDAVPGRCTPPAPSEPTRRVSTGASSALAAALRLLPA